MKKPVVKRFREEGREKLGIGFREVGVERLEDTDIIDAETGKVFREAGVHQWGVEVGALSEADSHVGLGEQRLDPAPIERELRVIRILPNPRMVLCEYWELESRRTCVVNVGNNRKWTKGMRFKMEEPVGELEFARPWEYRGKAPRRRGRW